MARTAHHFPPSQTRKTFDERFGGPWHRVVVRDLRYSARSLAEAADECRRPRPRAVRRHVQVYSFPRHNRDASVGRWSAQEERRARQRLRSQVGRLRRLVNSGPDGGIGVDMADLVEIPPANHRHGSLRLA
ncbi:hypothetical protein OHA98_33560 [Streptomyces sp. NBC_00654]|uniref:hypothetical protein n=1 Tax=Streptomyces sp. NBC_00654 TaxID=2975799 RepID=UPI002251C187|nr:hypothetical protein [Streptomyces sp. NBC_00654]MCX4969600.1 hypothetical protein [Streptomyces sp. NBC_00654]